MESTPGLSLFWEKIAEGRKADRASNKTAPPLPPLS